MSGTSLLQKWRLLQCALRDQRLRAKSDVAVLQALIEFDRSHGCYPSNESLAEAAGVSPRTVRAAVRHLAANGYVTHQRRGPTSALYTIAYPDETASAEAAPPNDRKTSSAHTGPKDRKSSSGQAGERAEAERRKTGSITSKDRQTSSAESPYESPEESAGRAPARGAGAGEAVKNGSGTTRNSSDADTPKPAKKASHHSANQSAAPQDGDTQAAITVEEAVEDAHRTLQAEFPELLVQLHLRALSDQAATRGERNGPHAARRFLLRHGRDRLANRQLEQIDARSAYGSRHSQLGQRRGGGDHG